MTYLKSVLDNLDICCIQEHWLFSSEKHLLEQLSKNMVVIAKSVDEEQPELSMTARRGFGGVAIFWKEEIDDKVHILNDGNSRLQVIHLETDGVPICLINIYMPSDNKEMDFEYKDMISQLKEIVEKYKNTHELIVCGDMNGSVYRNRTTHDEIFKDFLEETSLNPGTDYPQKNTFYHHNGKSEAQIDYILSIGKNLVGNIQILEMNKNNTSDHVPVLASVRRQLVRRARKIRTVTVKTKWEKCDLEIYQTKIAEGAEKIMHETNGNVEENILQIEQMMHNTCLELIPNYRREKKVRTTGNSIWNKNMAEAAKNVRTKHVVWKRAGAPKNKDNPLKAQFIVAKRLLRKAQRQAYASQRDNWARKIMSASSSDNKLFHKMLRKQRSEGMQNTKTLMRGNQVAESNEDILSMWKDHFQELSNPEVSKDFDYEKYDLSVMQNNIIEDLEKGKTKIEPIIEEEIRLAILGLKVGKSPDVDGITAEHYKNASEQLLPIIKQTLNTIIGQLDIPQFLKGGILTPVLKKNKDRQNPANYRGITVTKIFAKILQSVLKRRIDVQIASIQNPLQRGFTEAIPMLFAAFLASEVIIESGENKEEVLLLTLDAEKAFDKLNHEILFNKLYHYGITGDMWILLRNMYREMNIQVKWGDLLTDKIFVNQGIQQGAKLSTSLYKCYNNAILDSVAESGLGSYIGTACVATPTCADDILVLAKSEPELQGIVDIIYHHTQRDLVKINPQKSELVCHHTKQDIKVNLGNNQIQKCSKTKHLGINRNDKNTVDVDERLKAGRATIYGLLGAGLQVRKGFSPLVSHNIWKVYALPRMTYGLEVMVIRKKDMDQMENMQRKIIKQIQGLPTQAANTAAYVLIGAIPVQLVIERNMLSLLMNILRCNTSVEYQIIKRQLAMREMNGNTFINRIHDILARYDMENVDKLILHPKSKYEWKALIKKHQNIYWHKLCTEDQATKSSLQYLQIQEKPLSSPHNIWSSVGNDPVSVKAGEIKVRLVTQTYLLQTVKAKHNKHVSPLCTLCQEANEDVEHFLLNCKALNPTRRRHLQKIKTHMDNIRNGLYQDILNTGSLIQLVMDCTNQKMIYGVEMKQQQYIEIEHLSRLYCYDMHTSRMRQMAGVGR